MGASDWDKEIKAKREAQIEREEKLHEFEAKRLEEAKGRPGRIVASQVFEGKTIPQVAEKEPTSSAALAMASGALATDADPETGGYKSLLDPGESLGVGSEESEDHGEQPEEEDEE